MFHLKKYLKSSIDAKSSLLKQSLKINKLIKKVSLAIRKKKTIFFCGNGGSNSDAQHLTAELLVRFQSKYKRKAISAISLGMDTSTLTACANDLSFDQIFSRPLEAIGKKGDVLIAISTSGNSKNVMNALKIAKKNSIFAIGFFGKNGGKCKKYCDVSIFVNHSEVARIQETHIFLGHCIIEELEKKLQLLN